jgi:Tol biopolymer transport system component/imidazolonepropionase-like amidohydrolase
MGLSLVLAMVTLPSTTTAESEPWDVVEAHGPSKMLSFSVQEGTWLGVDLHPDGDRFIFSLLGDLYVLPVAGGQALRITSGGGWDWDPRWSPDGSSIAFTSDRGGNFNIWLADADGGRPRPLTTEKDVRILDAAWAPDGDWLVARKRITDTSSIGTNELWLYSRRGGAGVQLTKKEEWAGVAEAVFSDDGRWIWFAGRRGRFSYNADPNQGLWQIVRLDRETGRLRPLTGESGGAARPTPSPDGSTLAIVRRVRANTVLELLDLATGHRREIADWLDRDEQEGFANGGIYPRIDWFPDGRRLLVPAGGRFWILDVESGTRTEIPFTAQVDIEVVDAVRPIRSPVQDEVAARILTRPVLSPDGTRVVFSGLGRLWTADLGVASESDPEPTVVAPRRLTRDQGREYGPAFSADGRWVTFTSWDDVEGGAVRVVSARGGRSRAVTAVGAKYTHPSFSPDGKSIAVLRGSGGHLRGGDLGSELWSDLVIVDVETGAERAVTETTGSPMAVRPRFSPDGRRILFHEHETPEPHTAENGVLTSVNLDGTDRRKILDVGQSTEINPSPDGQWIAFQEDHHAWLAMWPRVGGSSLSVMKTDGGMPVWRLSETAGGWMDFSADGKTVAWIHGRELRTLSLDALLTWDEERRETARLEAEALREGEDGEDGDEADEEEEVELPPSRAYTLDLRVPRAAPTGLTAFTGARVITMDGDQIHASATILVRDDRIEAVGPDVVIPTGAHVVDASGTTIIPGLIDVHAHLHFSSWGTLPEQSWRYLVNLAYGVTTVHDPSAFSQTVFGQAELVEAGDMVGPRVFSTGTILYGAAGNFRSDIQSRKDADRHIRRMKELGAISVKSYQQPRRDQRQWIVEACREHGLLDVPEGGGDLWNDLTMVVDGHSAIEHAIPIAPLYDDVIQLMSRSQSAYSPTLLVAYGGPFGELYYYARDRVWENERLLTFTPREVVDRRARRPGGLWPEEDWFFKDLARAASRLQRAGTRVTLGAHGQMQGLGAHWELWSLASEGAMSPHEALRAATIDGAEYLGMGADLGSIVPGKLADFVILEANPLTDIENSDDVRWVVKNGVLYDAATMNRLHPDPAERRPLMWEAARNFLPSR